MDDKLTIRVNVIDRYYPLKIDRKDEEKIRKAAKKINDTILQYQKVYSDKDEQDLLAMASLQFVTKIVENDEKIDIIPIVEAIKEIDRDLDEYLKKE
ncbi:MAG: cell division protein ZapA [Bacteroidales bacterium]|nr:cell division protein ZapA [Bacteroidales bacterium]